MANENREQVDDLLDPIDDNEQLPADDFADEQQPPADDNDEADAGDDAPADDAAPDESEEESQAKPPQNRDKKTQQFKPGRQPAGKEGKEGKGKAPPPRPDSVPLATFLEEKNARRAERERIAALEAELAKLKAPPPPKEEEPKIRDHATDPKGYVDDTVSAALKKLEAVKAEQQQATERAQAEARAAAERTADMEFRGHLERAESAFVAQNPDYYDAINHCRRIREAQLKMLYPEAPQEAIMRQIGIEEFNLAKHIASQNRNPIQHVYQLAAQYGYVKKQAEDGKGGQQQGNEGFEGVELPDVPGGPRQLPPDQRLGTGSRRSRVGDEDEEADPSVRDGYKDPFDDAFNELFARGRKSA